MIFDKSIYNISKPLFLTNLFCEEVQHTSQIKVCEKIGISRTIFTQIISGNYRLRGKSLRTIGSYLGLSDDEIIRKTGAFLDSHPRRGGTLSPHPNTLPKVDSNVVLPDPDNLVVVPIYSIEASAGMGTVNDAFDVISTVTLDRSILKQYSNNVDRIEGLKVRGNSMVPTLNDGDILFVDRFDDFYRDGLYILRIDDSLCAKRILKLPKNCIKVVSDNEAYESYVVDLNQVTTREFEIVARVVMKFTAT